jgi:cell division protein FtsQ
MLISMTPATLKERRQALRSQRRWQTVQSLWQFFLVTTLAAGLCWGVALPYWNIAEEKQVTIDGHQLMTADKVRSLLSLSYPQSLWQVKTHQLKTQLQDLPPIAEVLVTRELFPPQLMVTIKERQPVAIAITNQSHGFLDAEGIFIPNNFYRQDAPELKQLSLTVKDFQPQYRPYWVKLYPVINNSPVKILAVDWSNSSNLVLKTEVGMVHFGSYNSQFPKKLTVLARMKKLSSKVAKERIVYIDLTNPAYPTVKIKPEPTKKKSETSIVKTQ